MKIPRGRWVRYFDTLLPVNGKVGYTWSWGLVQVWGRYTVYRMDIPTLGVRWDISIPNLLIYRYVTYLPNWRYLPLRGPNLALSACCWNLKRDLNSTQRCLLTLRFLVIHLVLLLYSILIYSLTLESLLIPRFHILLARYYCSCSFVRNEDMNKYIISKSSPVSL